MNKIKKIHWKEAEQIMGCRLDRRRSFYRCDDLDLFEEWQKYPIYEQGQHSTVCSGCSESEMGHYTLGSAERGIGCRECGYTGRTVDKFYIPAEDLIKIRTTY